ncbi:MAG: serine/threonine-protein kinase, partial [Myxococcaceae bacterium]
MSTGPAPGTDEGEELGKYRLLKRLGIGGMAEVYLAETQGTAGFQKRLVVKRVLPELQTDPKFIEMFLDEARLAARLTHPNIAQTFELGDADGNYFIAMEHVPGVTLRALFNRLAQQGVEFPVDAAMRVMSQLLEALEYAHALTDDRGRPLRIVHRDVTPANVMVTPQGGVKLLDFGIARAVTRRHRTQVGFTKGKFGFMSPEQVKGEELDGRADVFAAGTVFYILLTGHPAFSLKAESREEIRDMVEGRFIPPVQRRPGLAPRLGEILLKAMAKHRDDRYPTAGAMLRDLEDYAADARLSLGGRALQELLKSAFPELSPATPDQTLMEHSPAGAPSLPPEPTSEMRSTIDQPPPPPDARLTTSTGETILDDEEAAEPGDAARPSRRTGVADRPTLRGRGRSGSALSAGSSKVGLIAVAAGIALGVVVLVGIKVVGPGEPAAAGEVGREPARAEVRPRAPAARPAPAP